MTSVSNSCDGTPECESIAHVPSCWKHRSSPGHICVHPTGHHRCQCDASDHHEGVETGSVVTDSDTTAHVTTPRDLVVAVIREHSPMRGHGTNAELMADLIMEKLNGVRADALDDAAQEAPETLGGADQWAWLRGRAASLRHHPECTCILTDPKTWTTHAGAVEPGSQMEPDPDCPVHFPAVPGYTQGQVDAAFEDGAWL